MTNTPGWWLSMRSIFFVQQHLTSTPLTCSVTQLSCSPSESVFVSAASNAIYGSQNASVGSLVSWNLKTMQMQQSFELEGSEASSVINTVQYNHNGQLLVSGNDQGLIKIFGRWLTLYQGNRRWTPMPNHACDNRCENHQTHHGVESRDSSCLLLCAI
jgi:hypothetical protein